jgi:hypothetical protein
MKALHVVALVVGVPIAACIGGAVLLSLTDDDPSGAPTIVESRPPSVESPSPKGGESPPKSVESTPGWSPNQLTKAIEERARKEQASQPGHGFYSIVSHAQDPNEFAALGRNSLMLVTAISQKAEELPLKRLFIRARNQDVALQKVTSWRSHVGAGTRRHEVYGPNREDGYYLIPTGMLLRDGQMLIAYATDPTGVVIQQLPLAKVTADSLRRTLPNLDAPSGKPDLEALQAFVARQFPGFPVPKSLP